MRALARIGMAITVAAAVVGPVWATPATGAEAAATTCTLGGMTLKLTPGLTTKTQDFTFKGTTKGTVDCKGPVLGKKVTGPGVWARDAGTGTGSCTGGKGTYEWAVVFPTADGKLKLTDKGTYTFGPLKGGAVGGEFDGEKFAGSFSTLPKKGDCVTSPLTVLTVEGKSTLK